MWRFNLQLHGCYAFSVTLEIQVKATGLLSVKTGERKAVNLAHLCWPFLIGAQTRRVF